MALAVSVGLYATCTITYDPEETSSSESSYSFSGAENEHFATRQSILEQAQHIDTLLARGDYAALQHLTSDDYFTPIKYVLAALGDDLPPGMHIATTSQIPPSSGLGSGGALFAALASLLDDIRPDRRIQEPAARLQRRAAWAVRGDIIAHGGTASGLDTQTSLYGGAIRYTAERQGEPIACADGLTMVIGNTNVFAATSQVNARVRAWLAEQPARLHYFQEIGLLARHAEDALRDGDWVTLGHLINLNQLILARIGVSVPELEALNQAAIAAGALGAKLTGSGGGGIMFALVTPDSVSAVQQAILQAGGQPIVAPVGVPGVVIHAVPS